ncbi:MAG: PP2C family protein-serine/threonine phosphatase [Acidobacteriaceae bacterium]
MASTNFLQYLLNKTILSPARREQFAYMRSIPFRRLVLLNLAAAALFTGVGFLSSIRSELPQNYLFAGFSAAICSGIFAGVYTLLFARKPIWAFAVIPAQIFANYALRSLTAYMQQYQTPLSFVEATRVYAVSALVATSLSYALFFRFIQTEGRHAFRARTELALAHTIQTTLVPAIDMTIAGCEVYGLSLPSAKVGGDLVDVATSPAGDGFAYLVDVAGHGLNAGILMGMVKTAVRTCLAYESTPGLIFDTLNQVLPGVKESHMYATCAALQLKQHQDGRCDVSYALAGHPPLLHLAASGEIKPRLTDEQFPLGLLPFAGYQTRSINVAPGDLLVAATDGILETCGKDDVEFGAEGLERLASAHTNIPLATLAQKIFATVAKIGPQDDDRTLLLIRVL